MQSATPGNIVYHPASRLAPCTPRGPMLLDARPGDTFFVGDDADVLYALLSSPQVADDGKRRWCVAIASNDPLRPIGSICSAPVETLVCPVRAEDMRIVRDPLAWAGR